MMKEPEFGHGAVVLFALEADVFNQHRPDWLVEPFTLQPAGA